MSQVAGDKSSRDSLSWYNQTGGTMTPHCLLHKTWFVCAEPEKPSCKFFAWMPPAAASQRVRCSAKCLRSLCFGSKITCGRRRACPLNFKCLSSTKPWVLIQTSSVLGWVFIFFFLCFSYSGPDLTDLSVTRGSDNLGSTQRQLLWREIREGKGTPVNPPRLCFIATRNSITSTEHGVHESAGFSDKLCPTTTPMSWMPSVDCSLDVTD